MNDVRRHLIFVSLIVAYVAIVLLTGMKLILLSTRIGGYGMEYFVISAWCACYWQGPYTRGAFDPYPYRSAAVLVGVVGMIGALAFKMGIELR